MGYMGLEHSGESDMAADLMLDIYEDIIKRLKRNVSQSNGEYNTSGAINVAFVFDEILSKVNNHYSNDKLKTLAEECIKHLDIEIADINKLENSQNKQYHLKHYKRLRKSVKKFTMPT